MNIKNKRHQANNYDTMYYTDPLSAPPPHKLTT
jgi:hypothetical protein